MQRSGKGNWELETQLHSATTENKTWSKLAKSSQRGDFSCQDLKCHHCSCSPSLFHSLTLWPPLNMVLLNDGSQSCQHVNRRRKLQCGEHSTSTVAFCHYEQQLSNQKSCCPFSFPSPLSLSLFWLSESNVGLMTNCRLKSVAPRTPINRNCS